MFLFRLWNIEPKENLDIISFNIPRGLSQNDIFKRYKAFMKGLDFPVRDITIHEEPRK